MIERVRLQKARKVSKGGNYFQPDESEIQFFSSGSTLLDLALGGGWAERRIINIRGDTSTGKTLLATEAAANFLRKYHNGKVRYREVESAFLKGYAESLGLPLDRVDFGKRPLATIEDLYEELQTRVKTAKAPELMIVDSLDALSTRAELDRKIDAASYGGEKGKQMSALFRRINSVMAAKNITMMIISQIRDKMNTFGFGPKTTSSGGHAVPFYSSQRVVLTYLGKIKKKALGLDRVIGIDVRANVEKNKVGPGYRDVEFPVIFNYGIQDEESCEAFLKQIKKSSTGNVKKAAQRYWREMEEAIAPKARKYGEL
jgi:recombination protein RecA